MNDTHDSRVLAVRAPARVLPARPSMRMAIVLCLYVCWGQGPVHRAAAQEVVPPPVAPAAPGPGAAAQISESSEPSVGANTSNAQAALRLLDEGLALAYEEDWRGARAKFQQAKQLAPFPNIVYHLAQAHYQLEDWDLALQELAQFKKLAGHHNPHEKSARTLHQRVDTRLRAKQESPDEPGLPEPVRPAPLDVPLGPVVTLAAGGAALIAGTMTGLLTNAAGGELERNCPERVCNVELEVGKDRGETMMLASNVLLVAGAVAVGAGATWWLLSGSAEESSHATGDLKTGAACSLDGCGASLSVSF